MRAKSFPRRDITPDPKYGSVIVARLVNRAMRSGKKSVAQKQIYDALALVEKTLNRKALDILDEVLNRVTPQMEVRSRRVGGASYQVPMPVTDRRGSALAIRWLINEANKRPNRAYHTFAEKLAAEMMDALKEEGGTFQKKLTTHKMADANKAFAHFRW